MQTAETDHVRLEYVVSAQDALTIRVALQGTAPIEADGDCPESMCAMLEEFQRRAFARGVRIGRGQREQRGQR